jgi:hypothetical protein
MFCSHSTWILKMPFTISHSSNRKCTSDGFLMERIIYRIWFHFTYDNHYRAPLEHTEMVLTVRLYQTSKSGAGTFEFLYDMIGSPQKSNIYRRRSRHDFIACALQEWKEIKLNLRRHHELSSRKTSRDRKIGRLRSNFASFSGKVEKAALISPSLIRVLVLSPTSDQVRKPARSRDPSAIKIESPLQKPKLEKGSWGLLPFLFTRSNHLNIITAGIIISSL